MTILCKYIDFSVADPTIVVSVVIVDSTKYAQYTYRVVLYGW